MKTQHKKSTPSMSLFPVSTAQEQADSEFRDLYARGKECFATSICAGGIRSGDIYGHEASASPHPVLMKPDDATNIARAAYSVGVSEKTVRRWFKSYRIGRQSSRSAPIQISLPATHMVAAGDIEALELLRAGERNHPVVRRYLDFLGIPA